MSIDTCKGCGALVYDGNQTLFGAIHKCPPAWEAVEPWKGEANWEEARTVLARDAEDAAEKYREVSDPENAHFPTESVVWVRRKGEEKITKFIVEFEARPHYSAEEIGG